MNSYIRIFGAAAAAGVMSAALALNEAGAPAQSGPAPQSAATGQGAAPPGRQVFDPGDARYLQFRDETKAHFGYAAFCERLPAECDHRADYQQVVVMDEQTLQDMAKLNLDINAAITYTPDNDQYLNEELWALPSFEDGKGMRGDCEDYVLIKMKELNGRLGVPYSAMSIVFVKTEDGGGHAILAVRSDRGDILFDNRHDNLSTPAVSGYRFLSASSFTDQQNWRNLEQQTFERAEKGGRLSPPKQKQFDDGGSYPAPSRPLFNF